MRKPILHVLRIALSAATLAAGAETALAGDLYDDAMARSVELEQRGDAISAARELEAVAAEYPQDYAIALRIGWLRFNAGHYDAARRAYAAALALSPSSADARAGLAWSLARLGRCPEAAWQFRLVLSAQPDHAPARDGLTYCTPKPAPSEWHVTPAVSLTAHVYPDHTIKSYAGGVTGSLDVLHRSGWVVGATYRYTHFWTRDETIVPSFGQHEIYARTGYEGSFFGLSLQYALAVDGSGYTGTSHHAGASLRFSPFGDIMLAGSASIYEDMNVFRLEPSWRIPIAGGFSIKPAGAIQRTATETLGTAMLTLSLDRAWGGLYAGGKYGEEVRPAYLGLSVVANTPDRIQWGLWAGGSVNVGAGVRINMAYSMDRLEQSTGDTSNAHFITLGLAKQF